MVFSVPTIRADPAAAKQAEVPIRVKERDPTIKKICARSAFPICENLRSTKDTRPKKRYATKKNQAIKVIPAPKNNHAIKNGKKYLAI